MFPWWLLACFLLARNHHAIRWIMQFASALHSYCPLFSIFHIPWLLIRQKNPCNAKKCNNAIQGVCKVCASFSMVKNLLDLFSYMNIPWQVKGASEENKKHLKEWLNLAYWNGPKHLAIAVNVENNFHLRIQIASLWFSSLLNINAAHSKYWSNYSFSQKIIVMFSPIDWEMVRNLFQRTFVSH